MKWILNWFAFHVNMCTAFIPFLPFSRACNARQFDTFIRNYTFHSDVYENDWHASNLSLPQTSISYALHSLSSEPNWIWFEGGKTIMRTNAHEHIAHAATRAMRTILNMLCLVWPHRTVAFYPPNISLLNGRPAAADSNPIFDKWLNKYLSDFWEKKEHRNGAENM